MSNEHNEYADIYHPVRQVAKATVSTGYVGPGAAQIVFDGETATTEKAYNHLAAYEPVPGDVVLVGRVGHSWVILGVIGGISANNHGDTAHCDQHADDGHSDAHGDAGHSDTHGDVAHGDTHSDVSHSDDHSDEGGHGDSHTDSHSDAHTDSHTDVAHGDFGDFSDSHGDFSDFSDGLLPPPDEHTDSGLSDTTHCGLSPLG